MKEQNHKTEKLTDKAFSRLCVTSIIGILVCLACLCSTTWAWFSADTSSSENVIQSGEGRLVVTVTDAQVQTVDAEQGAVLEAGDYTVTMTLPQGSASGYCEIRVGEDTYRSPYLLRSQEADQTLVFYLTLTERAEVSIKARWGIYSDGTADVEGKGALTLPKAQADMQE